MQKTLLTAITIAFLSHGANAAYTLSDLKQIEAFVESRNWSALHEYLLTNPEILSGSDQLALEAREFQRSYRSTGVARFFIPPTPPSIQTIENLTEQY